MAPRARHLQVGRRWFERLDNGMDWPIETSATAIAAFATGIASSDYATNAYAALSTTPIPPP